MAFLSVPNAQLALWSTLVKDPQPQLKPNRNSFSCHLHRITANLRYEIVYHRYFSFTFSAIDQYALGDYPQFRIKKTRSKNQVWFKTKETMIARNGT